MKSNKMIGNQLKPQNGNVIAISRNPFQKENFDSAMISSTIPFPVRQLSTDETWRIAGVIKIESALRTVLCISQRFSLHE